MADRFENCDASRAGLAAPLVSRITGVEDV
jgi:hypothetical protein